MYQIVVTVFWKSKQTYVKNVFKVVNPSPRQGSKHK